MHHVSIVIPSFNSAAFIQAALASATAQTLKDIEIIVVDDASTDVTAHLVEEAARVDPRIRLLRQPHNAGPSAARNAGIAVASGRWIALLDSDDSYATERLARLVEVGDRRGADLVSDNLMLVPEQHPAAAHPMIPQSLLSAERPLSLVEFVRRNTVDASYPAVNYGFLKPIIRREFLRSRAITYDTSVRFAEDFALYLDCFRNDAEWWLVPEAMYHYQVRSNSLTQVQTVHDLGRLRQRQARLLREAQEIPDAELVRLVRRHMRVVDRCYYYRGFTDELKRSRWIAALRYVLEGPAPAALILAESLRQIPVVTRKALRGGYRRGSSMPSPQS